jgi:hypothetical protein
MAGHVIRNGRLSERCKYKVKVMRTEVAQDLVECQIVLSGNYPLPCLLFKTQCFRDQMLSPSSGGTYPVGPNR